jgi:asparagine synthase (glutamine-hydrolysing)
MRKSPSSRRSFRAMCGIAGQLLPPGQRVDAGLLSAMTAALEHRGPDARGVHFAGRVGLGIQRLRVIDLSTGDQPIFNEDRSIVVVLNGEIYNYRELRRELRARGHHFATEGDTEVIVHLYEEHGASCVKRLHGMFAFALWDERAQQLLLARDRVGKKPLLYALRGGVLSWASEMQALLQDDSIPRQVDPDAIDRYLTFGYIPSPRTALLGVRKLPAAHTLLMREGRVHIERYWWLDYSAKLDHPVDDLCARLRHELLEATRRRLIADVPVGAFLSGGIDSSAVVAAMAQLSSQPVRTFSIGFDHHGFDELPAARRVARRFGTLHEEFQVRADAAQLVPRIVRHYGEPFADSSAIPAFYLAEVTRREVTVALNGDGGDESFAGYQRYVANALAGRLDALPRPARGALALLGRRLPQSGRESNAVNRLRRISGSLALDPAMRYARYTSWFDAEQRQAVYTGEFAAGLGAAGAEAELAARWSSASGRSSLDRMLELDAGGYLVDDLITKIDIATMAHGLEARSPFLDHQLMEFAATIPAELKVRGTQKKWILRQALRPWLPADILDRHKQGFSVPLASWLRGELRGWTRAILLDPATRSRGYFKPTAIARLLDRHDRGADGDAKRIYALVMLELWHREFIDGPVRAMAAVA